MTSYHEQVRAMGLSESFVAGVDLLTDDGMSMEKAVNLLLGAERGGKDAEAFARHLLRLRRSLRQALR